MNPRDLRRYREIQEIGQGAYGKIYLVENLKDHKEYALKKMLINVR